MRTTSPLPRIPLNTFGIGLGLAGLAESWTIAADTLGSPSFIADALWAVAAIAWAWLIIAHIVRGAHSNERLWTQLHHPIQAPFASLAPVVAMLLGARLHHYAPVAGTAIVLSAIVAAAFLAVLLIVRWVSGNVPKEAIHGGYLVPMASAGLVAGGAAAQIGLSTLAIAALAIGGFFWVIVFAIVLVRLALLGPLPKALIATMAVVMSPPAVAAEALFTLNGGEWNLLGFALLVATAFLLLMQLAFVRRYRALPFSLGFWSFTFPLAAIAGQAMEWLEIARPIGWTYGSAALLAGLTVVVLGVAAGSLRLAYMGHKSKLQAVEQAAEVPNDHVEKAMDRIQKELAHA